MRLCPRDRDLEPGLGRGAGDHADRCAFRFQERALFDVQLEIGRKIARPGRIGFALPADARELLDGSGRRLIRLAPANAGG